MRQFGIWFCVLVIGSAAQLIPSTGVHATGAPGVLTPPVAALHPIGERSSTLHHGLGAIFPNLPKHPIVRIHGTAAALPASADLSQYAVPVGDQGGVNACSAWATAYNLRGWFAKRAGNYPGDDTKGTGGFAPMFTYSQVTNGQNIGTSIRDNWAIIQTEGVAPRQEYTHDNFDFADLPSYNDIYGPNSTAGQYKAGTMTPLFFGNPSGDQAKTAIETALAAGKPVVLGYSVYDNFYGASSSNPLIGLPGPRDKKQGGHATIALKYDANGVWIENQWGTDWGLNGWAEMSWAYVANYVNEVETATIESSLNILANGGFESGLTSWTPSTSGASISRDSHWGTQSVKLCGMGNCDARITQLVTLPASFTGFALYTWNLIRPSPSDCNDSLIVWVKSPDGSKYLGQGQGLPSCAFSTSWSMNYFDLSSNVKGLGGQQVQIQIEAKTASSSTSAWNLDDLQLLAFAGQAGPITFAATPNAPSCATSPCPYSAIYGQPFSLTITASQTGVNTLTPNPSGLPSGFTAKTTGSGNKQTVTVTGSGSGNRVTEKSGSYTLTVQATNNLGGTSSQNFTINVFPQGVTSLTTIQPSANVDPLAPIILGTSTATGTLTFSATWKELWFAGSDGSAGSIIGDSPFTVTVQPVTSGGSTPTPAGCTTVGAAARTGASTLTGSCTVSGLADGVYLLSMSIGGQFFSGNYTIPLTVVSKEKEYGNGIICIKACNGPAAKRVLAHFGFIASPCTSSAPTGGIAYVEHRVTGDVTVSAPSLSGCSLSGNPKKAATITGMGLRSDTGSQPVALTLTASPTSHGTPGKIGLKVMSGSSPTDITFGPTATLKSPAGSTIVTG